MKQYIKINGVVICYDDTMETDKKPLLLYHGLTGSKEVMYFMRDELKKDYRIITIDARGHGESSHPAEYSLSDHGDDVHALIKALGLAKADILGYSMGSYIALCAAEKGSDDIGHLILLGTKGAGKTSSVERIAKEKGIDMKTLSTEDLQKMLLACAFAPKTLEKMKTGEFVYTPDTSGIVLSEEEKASESRSLADFDLLNDLDKVSCKTLVIAGEYDGINPKEYGKEVADGIEGCRYEVITDTGHMVPYEKPEEFYALVREFLES